MNTISILIMFSVCAIMLLAEYSLRNVPNRPRGDALGSSLFAFQRLLGASQEAALVAKTPKHSSPLWNPGDCALELLAWGDPILDGPGALSMIGKPAKPSAGSKAKGAFVAPKGTWLWYIQTHQDLRSARSDALKTGSEVPPADVAESKTTREDACAA